MEPAIDLAIAIAVVSSFRNQVVDSKLVAFGEVGLSGEVRAVSMAKQRVAEALKLGFTTCVMPYASAKECKEYESQGMKIVGVKSLQDVIDYLGR